MKYMDHNTLLEFFLNHPEVSLFGAVTFIEIVPVKINPWSTMLRFIRKALVGELENEVKSLRRDFDEEKVARQRWAILDFANSCRNGRKHSKEEWSHCLSQLKDYEHFCKKRDIENGVIEEDAKYLRDIYHNGRIKQEVF